MKSTSDCRFFKTSTHMLVLFSWREAITFSSIWSASSAGITTPSALATASPSFKSKSATTREPGVSNTSLPSLALIVVHTWLAYLSDRSVSVDIGLTAKLYNSLHQICFLISVLASLGSPCSLNSVHNWLTLSDFLPSISPTQLVRFVWALIWPGPSMLAPWAVRPPKTFSWPTSSAINSSLPRPFWKEMKTVS